MVTRLAKLGRAAFADGFQGLFTAGVVALWWLLPWRADTPVETAAGLLVVANLVVYGLEHLMADVQEWAPTGADRRIDSFYLVLRVAIVGPTLQLLVLLTIEPFLMDRFQIWPHGWPLAAKIALVLVLGETIAFFAHRSMHRWATLWSVHATHHVQTKLNSVRWSSGHPLENVVMTLPILVSIVVLGPGYAEVAGGIIIGRMTVVIAHSNLPLTTWRWYGLILTTPAQHRRHHAPYDTATNFGDALILLDRIFGTYSADTTRNVGVGETKTLPLRTQLLLPWRMSALEPSEKIIDLTGGSRQDLTDISA